MSTEKNPNSRIIEGIRVAFEKEEGIFSQIQFSVNAIPVSVIGQFNSPEFEIFLLDIPAYASQISSILSTTQSSEENISIIAPQKMILIGSDTYYLDA